MAWILHSRASAPKGVLSLDVPQAEEYSEIARALSQIVNNIAYLEFPDGGALSVRAADNNIFTCVQLSAWSEQPGGVRAELLQEALVRAHGDAVNRHHALERAHAALLRARARLDADDFERALEEREPERAASERRFEEHARHNCERRREPTVSQQSGYN